MITKKPAAKSKKSVEVGPSTTKSKTQAPLSIDKKDLLIGDYPAMLDLSKFALKHKGEIRISGSDLVEAIYLPDGEFSDITIEDLPNLKEIHATGTGPTWMTCKNLPKLNAIRIDAGTRWLHIDGATSLQDIDVGNCEHLGYLAVFNAPSLRIVNVEGCRLLPHIFGLSADIQDNLGVTKQIELLQAGSKRDSIAYLKMTCTDIQLVLANIRLGEELLKKQYQNSGDEDIDDRTSPSDYNYRLLEPGEKVYTGGTGESYCYAFQVSSQCISRKKTVTRIDHERGIHEPEDSIGEALSWVISGLHLPNTQLPSNDQLLSFLNLLLSAPEGGPASWIETDDLALRLALASNPLMPTSVLEQLANDQNSNIRLVVAENPNTDFEVRRNLLHELVTETDPATRRSIAQSAATSPTDLETLSKDSDVEILCAIADNPLSPSTLRAAVLEALSTCGESIGLLLVARSSDTPEQLFSRLLTSSDRHVIVAVSENVAASDSIRSAALEKLATIDDPEVKRSVAKNKLTPPAVLDSLTKGADSRLLVMISANQSTPTATLEYLAKSDDWGVRCGVAGNPCAPPPVLLALSKDMDADWGEYIRKSVAGNPATPQSAFKFLVKDKDWQARAAIAENIATPEAIFEILAKDKEYSVRERVARNFQAPARALEMLSTDKYDNIKMYVARNPNSSAGTLTRLATDPYDATRRDVASNMATPHSVLQELLKDTEPQVRDAAEKSLGGV